MAIVQGKKQIDLDKASQGLILMTNDGMLSNKILEAVNEHEKEYIVTVDKPFDDLFLRSMSNGVQMCIYR